MMLPTGVPGLWPVSETLPNAVPGCGPHLRLPNMHLSPQVFVEARIMLPTGGPGLWPAFWMLPNDDTYGGWPTSGEVRTNMWQLLRLCAAAYAAWRYVHHHVSPCIWSQVSINEHAGGLPPGDCARRRLHGLCSAFERPCSVPELQCLQQQTVAPLTAHKVRCWP
jgi:hypothetical protein